MLSETLKILNKEGIKLDKRKGQNYLIDNKVLSQIIQSAELSINDTVLEIGAGIGTLTIPLAKNAGKVIAIEQDKRIAAILIKRLDKLNISNVDVIVGDATKLDFPKFNKVVSNLPYKISSPITFKILEKKFDSAILMYQLEFAERMIAKSGDSNYSRLSVMMHFYAEVEMLFNVSKDVFFPKPKISSAVIKLTPKNKVEFNELFLKVTRALFQHKRKKVRNALMDSFHEINDLDKNERKIIISKLDQNIMDKRVIMIEPDSILKLSKELEKLLKEYYN
ncbi:16S rRNA (adenine(1518)-N(6)/adenine(1519)-N(6))-dimethyltransferase RsmA [Methanobacterium spitsbergense]|uniref:Probable ribosomal RNA small subunit methyltransferase A n=1 Tax=Methanobacterium spitsbergense TaxID=2874285 RepID=A0A8T5UM62_9EURY|nr:16S rRNA (adenine(1518)-N(6)/adenine(1519)-N(6))-dimethyltransferase RsmA [Methanobacterium spitsbergense]MBZ2164972.1 16S ribosomal RNA methyltransferase A [Methanobacterium spitsbergense]